jgi:hypothetical protein
VWLIIFTNRLLVGDGKIQGNSELAFPDADFALQAATVFGVSESIERISQQVNFKCLTSHCRYPKHRSIAICSRCESIDDYLKTNTASIGSQFINFAKGNPAARVRPNQTEYRLPNGLFLNNLRDGQWSQMVYMTMAGTPHPGKTIKMGGVDTLIWSQSVIKVEVPESLENALWPDFPVHATECALYYCVREYDSEVNNGTLVERSVELTNEKRDPESWQISRIASATGGTLSDSFNKSIAFDKTQSFPRRTDLRLGDRFNLSQAAVDSISHFVQLTFGPCLNASGICDFNKDPINGYFVTEGGLKTGMQQYEPPAAKVFYDANDLGAVFDKVARSMSNAIRNGADEGAAIEGIVGITTTVYDIDWRWIVLHGLILIGAVLFLITTVWASSTRFARPLPVWKSSSLAVLLRHNEEFCNGLGACPTREELEHSARSVRSSLLDLHSERQNRFQS